MIFLASSQLGHVTDPDRAEPHANPKSSRFLARVSSGPPHSLLACHWSHENVVRLERPAEARSRPALSYGALQLQLQLQLRRALLPEAPARIVSSSRDVRLISVKNAE